MWFCGSKYGAAHGNLPAFQILCDGPLLAKPGSSMSSTSQDAKEHYVTYLYIMPTLIIVPGLSNAGFSCIFGLMVYSSSQCELYICPMYSRDSPALAHRRHLCTSTNTQRSSVEMSRLSDDVKHSCQHHVCHQSYRAHCIWCVTKHVYE
jgi:hypothetical protein